MNFLWRYFTFTMLSMAFLFSLINQAQAISINELTTERVPRTCDENFWNTLSNRAWQQGQREVTQNGNLLAKPDSVLTYSCFDKYLEKLAMEGYDNYPGDPNETFDESYQNIGRQLWQTNRPIFDAPGQGDAFLKNVLIIGGPSILMEAALEILILDTLVSDVSFAQPVSGNIDDIAAPICGRNFYIEDSTFQHNYLGGRTGGTDIFNNDVNRNNYNCDRMARVWDEARCYNFQGEPTHDGFYTYDTYVSSGGDYRTLTQSCVSSSTMSTAAMYGGLLCNVYFHGIPAIPLALYWPWSGTPPLNWATADAGAEPIPGAPGGVQPYATFRNLYTPAACASQAPIKTGVVVTRRDGTTYDDAYCIAPGCRYDPAVSTTACQPF